LQCVAVCCSVLQCVAVCCSVLQCVAVCRSVLQCVAVCCRVMQCVAVCCTELQCAAASHITCVWSKDSLLLLVGTHRTHQILRRDCGRLTSCNLTHFGHVCQTNHESLVPYSMHDLANNEPLLPSCTHPRTDETRYVTTRYVTTRYVTTHQSLACVPYITLMCVTQM